MKYTKSIPIILIIAGLLAYAIPKIFESPVTPMPVVKSTQTSATYPTPTKWVALSSDNLSKFDADSGLILTVKPFATFTMAIEPQASTPKDLAGVKASTDEGLAKLEGFKLISYGSSKVDGESAVQYIYTIGTTTKTQQQLIIALHDKRAYSLLFTCPSTDFASQSADFKQIVDGFKFNK